MIAPKCSLAKILHIFVLNSLHNNMHPNSTKARPEDDAYNIQRGHLQSQISVGGPCSNFPSPMDELPPSEVNYTVSVTLENNIEMSASESLILSSNNA